MKREVNPTPVGGYVNYPDEMDAAGAGNTEGNLQRE